MKIKAKIGKAWRRFEAGITYSDIYISWFIVSVMFFIIGGFVTLHARGEPEPIHIYETIIETQIEFVDEYEAEFYDLQAAHDELIEQWFALIDESHRLANINETLTGIIGDRFDELEDWREAWRRSQPIFIFEDNVLRGHPDPDVELQWMIYDLLVEHDINVEMVLGIIAHESNFNVNSHHVAGNWRGLAQISPFWLRAPVLEPYRLTDDYRDRDLFDPYHNMLTLIEMHEYFMTHNELDRHCFYAQNAFIWFHGSGRTIDEGFEGNSWTRTVWRFASQINPATIEEVHTNG